MKQSLPADNCGLNPVELLAALNEEFYRLNATYFGDKLSAPEIIVSRRKMYGGYYSKSRHRIVVSLQAYTEHGWHETLNTFRHEVAHILVQDHSERFWAIATTIGVERRYAKQPLVQAPKRTPKYIYVCSACGRRYPRQRPLKRSSCSKCDKRFNAKFLLRLLTVADSSGVSTG